MLRDITIGQHFPGNSLVHRFDPRLKLVLTVAYIVLLFAASNPLGLTLSILFLGVMYKVAKIPVKMIGKSLKPILPIVVFTAVLNLFFVSGEGEPLVHIGFLTIYAEGVRYAVLMAVRVMALIAGTSLLTYTTSPIVLTDAIEQLLKPLGAGDSFLGAFLAGFRRGLQPQETLRYAASAASITISGRSCSDSMPTATELDSYLMAWKEDRLDQWFAQRRTRRSETQNPA